MSRETKTKSLPLPTEPVDGISSATHSPQKSPEDSTRPSPGFAADTAWLEWLEKQLPAYRFYHLTVVFKERNLLQPFPSRFLQLYSSPVCNRLLRLAGASNGALITDIVEYECATKASLGNLNCPHHVHSILGVPLKANHDRLLRRSEKDIGSFRFVSSVKLQPLRTLGDVQRVYAYIRKYKRRELPGESV